MNRIRPIAAVLILVLCFVAFMAVPMSPGAYAQTENPRQDEVPGRCAAPGTT